MANHIYRVTGALLCEESFDPIAERGIPHWYPIDRRVEAVSDESVAGQIKAEYVAKAGSSNVFWWDGPEISDEGEVPEDILMRRAGVPDLFSCVE